MLSKKAVLTSLFRECCYFWAEVTAFYFPVTVPRHFCCQKTGFDMTFLNRLLLLGKSYSIGINRIKGKNGYRFWQHCQKRFIANQALRITFRGAFRQTITARNGEFRITNKKNGYRVWQNCQTRFIAGKESKFMFHGAFRRTVTVKCVDPVYYGQTGFAEIGKPGSMKQQNVFSEIRKNGINRKNGIKIGLSEFRRSDLKKHLD